MSKKYSVRLLMESFLNESYTSLKQGQDVKVLKKPSKAEKWNHRTQKYEPTNEFPAEGQTVTIHSKYPGNSSSKKLQVILKGVKEDIDGSLKPKFFRFPQSETGVLEGGTKEKPSSLSVKWKDIWSGSSWSEGKWEAFVDEAVTKGLLQKTAAAGAKYNWQKAAPNFGYQKGNLASAKKFYEDVDAGEHKAITKGVDNVQYKQGGIDDEELKKDPWTPEENKKYKLPYNNGDAMKYQKFKDKKDGELTKIENPEMKNMKAVETVPDGGYNVTFVKRGGGKYSKNGEYKALMIGTKGHYYFYVTHEELKKKKVAPSETNESLSRGSLYRRRYYGRY